MEDESSCKHALNIFISAIVINENVFLTGVSRKNKQSVTPNKFEAFGPVRQLSTGEKQSFLQRANALGSNAAFVIAMQPTHVFTPYILVNFRWNLLGSFFFHWKFSNHIDMYINVVNHRILVF